ncbi:MAG: adenylyl-sulfate kinase [Ramlibacter sp.]
MVSPIQQGREAARQIIGADRFLEVHVATPLSACQARDPKGLYKRARDGQAFALTGVQAAYEAPVSPQLVLDTSELALARAVQELLSLAQ